MYIKTIVLCSFLALTTQANEDINKTKIFNDKYLDSHRLNTYKNSNNKDNLDYKISNIKNMTTISKDTNRTVAQMIKTQLDKSTMKSDATIISEHKNSKSFQKKVLENEEYILYDEKINWQQHLGKHKNRSNKIIRDLKEKGSVSSSVSSNKYLNQNEKIYIVISSSIPNHIIKNYFEMLQNVNSDVTFVLRGTIGGIKKMMPTLNWIKELLKKQDNSHYEYNIIIEPRVTKKYNIEKVPAVLYIKDFDSTYTNEDSDEKYYIYYGTVDVDYALEKINIDVKSEGLKKLLKSI